MRNGNLVKTVFSLRARLLECLVYGGPHPQEEGWLLLFRFPNLYQATVVHGLRSHGIEVGVMKDDRLLEVYEDLSGSDVIKQLFQIMQRSDK